MNRLFIFSLRQILIFVENIYVREEFWHYTRYKLLEEYICIQSNEFNLGTIINILVYDKRCVRIKAE